MKSTELVIKPSIQWATYWRAYWLFLPARARECELLLPPSSFFHMLLRSTPLIANPKKTKKRSRSSKNTISYQNFRFLKISTFFLFLFLWFRILLWIWSTSLQIRSGHWIRHHNRLFIFLCSSAPKDLGIELLFFPFGFFSVLLPWQLGPVYLTMKSAGKKSRSPLPKLSSFGLSMQLSCRETALVISGCPHVLLLLLHALLISSLLKNILFLRRWVCCLLALFFFFFPRVFFFMDFWWWVFVSWLIRAVQRWFCRDSFTGLDSTVLGLMSFYLFILFYLLLCPWFRSGKPLIFPGFLLGNVFMDLFVGFSLWLVKILTSSSSFF